MVAGFVLALGNNIGWQFIMPWIPGLKLLEGPARALAERARATEIYATAYNKDAEFFRFQRALVACEKAIQKGTQLVISPGSMGICDQFFDSARAAGTPR